MLALTTPSAEVGSPLMTLDIVMPFYGRVDHFRVAVESVLAQTDGDWRLTIIDDVYPDLNAGRWAEAIPDARVRYIRNEKNLRPSRNYNKGAGLVSSEFFTLMGCDDLLEPAYVGRVKSLLMANPDVDVVQPGVKVIDAEGAVHDPLADRVKRLYRPRGGTARLSGARLATSLLRGNWTYFPSLVWRRELVTRFGFHVDLDIVQDLAMLLDIAFAGGTLLVDDDVVFAYRRHAESLSALTGVDGTKFAQERWLFEDAERRARALGWEGAARAARHHVSSRLHALSELPAATLSRDRRAIGALLRHATSRTKNPLDASSL